MAPITCKLFQVRQAGQNGLPAGAVCWLLHMLERPRGRFGPKLQFHDVQTTNFGNTAYFARLEKAVAIS